MPRYLGVAGIQRTGEKVTGVEASAFGPAVPFRFAVPAAFTAPVGGHGDVDPHPAVHLPARADSRAAADDCRSGNHPSRYRPCVVMPGQLRRPDDLCRSGKHRHRQPHRRKRIRAFPSTRALPTTTVESTFALPKIWRRYGEDMGILLHIPTSGGPRDQRQWRRRSSHRRGRGRCPIPSNSSTPWLPGRQGQSPPRWRSCQPIRPRWGAAIPQPDQLRSTRPPPVRPG